MPAWWRGAANRGHYGRRESPSRSDPIATRVAERGDTQAHAPELSLRTEAGSEIG